MIPIDNIMPPNAGAYNSFDTLHAFFYRLQENKEYTHLKKALNYVKTNNKNPNPNQKPQTSFLKQETNFKLKQFMYSTSSCCMMYMCANQEIFNEESLSQWLLTTLNLRDAYWLTTRYKQ